MTNKQKFLYSIFPAVSGGITGMTFAIACGHLGDRQLPAAMPGIFTMALFVTAGCVLSVTAWFCVSLFMSKLDTTGPEDEFRRNSFIFSAGLVPVLLLPLYIKFYPQLLLTDFKVVGWLYLPWGKFIHVNFAGYFLFMAAGAVIAAQAFLVMANLMNKLAKKAAALSEKRIEKILFVSLLVFYTVVTSYVTFIYPPTGDEPHYLTIARSMAYDRDVNLENDYVTEETYREFYPVEIDWKSIHNTPGKNNTGLYSLHSPGMPLVIAPVYAATGRFGVQLLYNALCALLCLLIYKLLRTNFMDENISLFAAMTAGLTLPVCVNSSLVLTEVPAAVIIAWCTAALRNPRPGKQTVLFFTGISALPFLHTKLAVFSLMLLSAYYVMIVKGKKFSVKKEAVNMIPLAAAAVSGIAYYYAIYGKFAPAALTSVYVSDSFSFIFSLKHSLKAAAGILFDRDFGLLPYNLLFVISIWGVILAAAKKDTEPLKPLFLALPYAALYLFWSDWGGSMTPARQLIPVVPALALCAAYFCRETAVHERLAGKFFTAYSLAISFIMMAAPVFRFTSGKEKLYAVLNAAAGPIMWILPSFNGIITSAQITVAALWIGVIAVLYVRYTRKRG